MRMLLERAQVRRPAGLEIVQADDMIAAHQQLSAKMRADEAGTSRDQHQRRIGDRDPLALSRADPLSRLDQVSLQLGATTGGAVLAEPPIARRPADRRALPRQCVEDVVRLVGKDDLLAGLEQRLDAVPPVRNDRRAAGAGLEDPYRWRPARRDHV